MTKEEALQILDTIPTIGDQVDALEMAIKALEQESVLDEITAEIKEKSGLIYKPNDYDLIPKSVLVIETSAVLQIIDKYRGEQNE